VTFAMYHELVVSHRSLFHTRAMHIEARESTALRAVLDTHVLASDGEHYLARFTLVRREGRWWIDDLRWGLAEQDTSVIHT